MPTNCALEVQNLSFQYSYHTIFSHLNFTLNAGQSLVLIGDNGSGKTTLLRILSGFLKPATGSVKICGETLWPNRKILTANKNIHCAYTPAFYSNLTCNKNIDFYLECYGKKVPQQEKFDTLKQLNLLHHENEIVAKLSTGQKRRLTLAILLLLKPDIIFADEPTNGLDSAGIELCLQIFSTLIKQYKTTLVAATHDEQLKNFCSSVIHLKKFQLHSTQQTKKIVDCLL